MNDGNAGFRRLSHGGLDIGDAGSGSGDNDAGLTGSLGIRNSGISAGALMADVNDTDAFLPAGVENGHDMPAGEGKNSVNAFLFHGFGKQLACVNLTH